MNPEMRQFIHEARFCLASVQRAAEFLPAEDAALDALLTEAAGENNPKLYLHVVVAALLRERRVEAKQLTKGIGLLGLPIWVGHMMLKAQGDVPEPVLATFEESLLMYHTEAGALLAMEDWCREHRQGQLPDKLMLYARKVARAELPSEATIYLTTLALRTKDAALQTILREKKPRIKPEKWQEIEELALKAGEEFLKVCRGPTERLIGERATNQLASGVTMRRAVAKVGRNDPCPCGSGRKYKHCCLEKDDERLHHSSDVAGVTAEELLADPNAHLTEERLYRMHPFEMAKLDPLKVPAELWKTYFMKLGALNGFDQAMEAMQSIGWSEAMEEHWDNVILFATHAGRKDVIERMMEMRKKMTGEEDVAVHLGTMLALEEANPTRVLQVMDETAREVLQDENPEHLKHMADGLLWSRNRALGILVARGVIPLLPSEEAVKLLDRILEARDVLNLPPDDPISGIVDERYAEHEEDNAKLREARQSLDTKAEEARELKEKLDGLQAEIVRRERKQAADAEENAPMKELRRKLEEMKSALNERQRERNQLRRDLQKARDTLESLRQTPATSPEEEAEAERHEESLLLPQDAPEVHPVRLADYPKGFLQTLSAFPRHVARAAVVMIGRLAAGEPAAFVGALRLKATPKVMRQRIGINYRLLFRLWPERLEVVDLINRKDLDRRLKTLV